MSNHFLLLGVGPLPCYDTDKLFGFGIRAWQFALPLCAAGHKITLVTFEFGKERENQVSVEYACHPSVWGDIDHIALPQPTPRTQNVLLTRLEGIIENANPDAIIACGSTISTNMAALLDTELPVWMDMFGDLIAEVQAKSPFSNNPHEIDFFHRILSRVLLRGDRFSTVSEMQRGAALGQLGLMGRLNRHTHGEQIVHTIPCAMNSDVSPVRRQPFLRDHGIQKGDFVLLCSGGFNTWADVETMFTSIEDAMDQDRSIHCVVTGGQISGHHEEGYNRFRSQVSKSHLESRFHLLGWLTNEEVAQITLESHLGINIDLPINESILGSRNRMLYWMQCGLPILTTITTELSQYLCQNELAIGAPPEQSRRLTRLILDASARRGVLKNRAVKAKRMAYRYLSYTETCRPLLEWANAPERAADNVERELGNHQFFNQVDQWMHTWAYSDQGDGGSTIPVLPKPVIRTRPQGKSIWKRLWGS